MATRVIRTGNGWKLSYAVPRALRAAAGQTTWIKWLNREYSADDADRARAAFDVECLATARRLKRLPEDESAALLKAGGLRALRKRHDKDQTVFAPLLEAAIDLNGKIVGDDPDPEMPGLRISQSDLDDDSDLMEVATLRAQRSLADLHKEVEARAPLVGTTGRADGLYTLCELAEELEPDLSLKGRKRARLYVKRLIEFLGGDRKPTSVRQSDIVDWRDAMAKSGLTVVNQEQHLAKLSGLFARALSEGKVAANPVAGVKPKTIKGTTPDPNGSKRAFTSEELRKFFKAAKAAPENEKADFALIAACLIYTGARSSEIAGLRVEDVRTIGGILAFDFNRRYRTLKKGADRIIPVPSRLTKRIAALTVGRAPDALLFEGQPMPSTRDCGAWYQNIASRIIRDIAPDDLTLSAHGTRHHWVQLSDDLQIDEQVSYAITGHAKGGDVRKRVYSKRPDLKPLKAAIDKVARAIETALAAPA